MNHTPGTLLFDLKGKLVYFNHEAMNYLPRLRDRLEAIKDPPELPEELLHLEILLLIEKAKTRLNHNKSEGPKAIEHSVLSNKEGQLLLRSFPVGDPKNKKSEHFILLLIEKASEKNLMDLPRAATVFKLTKRELEVIQLVCRGKTNKEISNLLFICEQTVKDHLKNLMRKMKVNSRTKIMSTLLNLPR